MDHGRPDHPHGVVEREVRRLGPGGRAERDRTLRAKNYTEAERILLEEGTIAPYAYATGFDYVHPYVKGYAAPTFTAMLYKTVSVER